MLKNVKQGLFAILPLLLQLLSSNHQPYEVRIDLMSYLLTSSTNSTADKKYGFGNIIFRVLKKMLQI